ncbi:MAG: hypothetical protein JSS97_13520 [Actinobacteria bacterium]|nr:hypothetical protein [Actinomycetota bacterium]
MRRAGITLGLVVLLASPIGASIALAGGKGKEGWGSYGSFVGRYHVKVLAGGSSGVRGGELTMFIQEEFPGSEEPAGILKLTTRTNNDVVYLKELKHRGGTRTAIVKGGSFLGPTIGSFKAAMKKPGVLAGTVSTRGLGQVKALFTRFSKKPTQ